MFYLQKNTSSLQVNWNGDPLLAYQYGSGSMPFWHPISMPGSPILTEDRPADHIHHHGLWLAWKSVNGVNFWEESPSGAPERGYGRIVNTDLNVVEVSSSSTEFIATTSWLDWRDKEIISDVRRTLIHRPTDTGFMIDLSIELLPTNGEVILDLRRGEPGQGGFYYSGLVIRLNDKIGQGEVLDADGHTDTESIFGSQSRWCGYSGVHQVNGKRYSVVIIDKPENPRYPTTWWVRNRPGYSLLHPSPTYYEPLKIDAGTSVTFQYKLLFYNGPIPVDDVEFMSREI